jgi:predicted secreted Zn-dependent protease
MELVEQSQLTGLTWHMSRRCNGGNCVRVAHDGKMIFLGSTTNPAAPALCCSRPQWQALIDRIKRGELDFG